MGTELEYGDPFDEFEPYDVQEFHKRFDLNIVDSMLASFYKAFPYETLYAAAQQGHPVDADYDHEGCTWDFTFERHINFQGDTSVWVHMSSDGFRYLKHGTFLSRPAAYNHRGITQGGWVALKGDFIKEKIPFVVEISERLNQPVRFLYNKGQHRIDITFGLGYPMLKICLEPGNPRSVNREEYFEYFGLKRT